MSSDSSVPVALADTGEPFPLPYDLDGWAVFLDVDGTLIDIAESPDKVVVPAELPGGLAAASARAGGALALVSGRSIRVLDGLFQPVVLPTAGLHGHEFRRPGADIEHPAPPPELATIRPALATLPARRPGVLIEDKGGAIAVHYRAAPDLGPLVEGEIRELVAPFADRLAIQPGKMVFEIRPAGVSKAMAVEKLMAEPVFAGRRPLAIGDDLTDEAMFVQANRVGGVSIRVGADQAATSAGYRLQGPSAVRRWINSFT